MFTDPPLGRVGMTVREARESGRKVLKAEVPMSSVSRAVLEGETTGLMRILVDADTEEFLGATILGLHADDLVQIIGTAMQTGVKYPAVRDALPIHPTMAEYIPSVLGSLAPLERDARCTQFLIAVPRKFPGYSAGFPRIRGNPTTHRGVLSGLQDGGAGAAFVVRHGTAVGVPEAPGPVGLGGDTDPRSGHDRLRPDHGRFEPDGAVRTAGRSPCARRSGRAPG